MSSRQRDYVSPETLVAGPERLPGTRQIRQPVIALGLGAFVLFFGAMLWFIGSHLGSMANGGTALAQSDAPAMLASAQPARTEDIGGSASDSNALPTPRPLVQPESVATLPPTDLSAAPITAVQTLPATPIAAGGGAGEGAAAVPATPSRAQIAAQEAAQRRQRAFDEARAAALAPLAVQFTRSEPTGTETTNTGPSTPAALPARRYSSPGDYDVAPASEYVVKRGMIIAATLYTSIDSTIGGTILAYVNGDVYDYSHRVVVWPRGSKLVGTFGGTSIAQGQARVPVAFDSIELTNGHTIALGNMPGIDLTGTSGFGAKVDNHTRALFGHVVLLSILSAGAQLSQPQAAGCSAGLSCAPSIGQSVGQAVGQTIAQAGATLLSRDANVQPTLHVAEGAQVAVMVQTDIPVKPWAP